MNLQKRALSVLLSAAMICNMGFTPVLAYAATGDTPIEASTSCEHHLEHTAECGYTEGTVGAPCTHTHTADCYSTELICGLTEEVVDNGSSSDAAHTHTQECYKLVCPHENGKHNTACGYIEKTAGTPCTYECLICSPTNDKPLDSGAVSTPSNATKAVTLWQFVDPDKNLSENTLALPGVNAQTQASFDDVVALLPTALTGAVNGAAEPATVNITGWVCESYKTDEGGNWPISGTYTFVAMLAEGYTATPAPTVMVELGGAKLLIGETGDFTVTGGTKGTDYSYASNTLTILKDTPLTISTATPTTTDKIVVQNGVTANVTLDGVNIQFSDGDMYGSGTCAFEIAGTAACNLTLSGDNTLKSGENKAGLQVQTGTTVTIDGAGTLNVTGGNLAAGIGGGKTGAGGTTTINGGTVTTTSGGYGAGIGGGHFGAGGTITINGGAVTASGGKDSAGIGGGYSGAGGTTTINGGIVTATSGGNGAGIGGGDGGAAGTFSTRTSGNAFIMASSIAHQDNKGEWGGIIFEGDNGKLYGTNISLSQNATIPTGKTLIIFQGETLTIPAGVTLQNNGNIIKLGTINGTVAGTSPTIPSATIPQSLSVTDGSIVVMKDGNDRILIQQNQSYYVGAETTNLTFTGTTTADKIVVADGVTANITLDGVNIDVSATYDACAFEAAGNATCNLTLKDGTTNIFKSGKNKAGLQVQTGAELMIDGNGTLTATGGYDGAGIGSGISGHLGKLTINSGTVNANGTNGAAGIGGGAFGNNGIVTINGGIINAVGTRGAGIGGGFRGAGGTTTIHGGTVTASGDAGIGGGIEGGAAGTFSTGTSGNAFIIASSIAHQGNKSNWNGVIFEGNTGNVYGTPTLKTNATIPSGKTLEIETGKTLIVGIGVTLTNNGTINNSGTITNTGIINNNGTLTGNIGGSGTVNLPSSVAVSFSNAAPAYGDNVTITATAQKKTGRGRLAAIDKVDFYLGDVAGGIKLGTASVTVSGETATATLMLTLSGTEWDNGFIIGGNTITADFGSSAGLQASSGTGILTVGKATQAAPSAPSGTSKVTSNTIILNTVSETGKGSLEYGYTVGSESTPGHWQTDVNFTNLSPGTQYTFYTRFAGNEYYEPKVSVAGQTVTTAEASPVLPADGLSLPQGAVDVKASGTNQLVIVHGTDTYLVAKDTEIMISGGTGTTNLITIDGVAAHIVLFNVSQKINNSPAISLQNNAAVQLSLKGVNTITSTGWGDVAVSVPDGNNLTIDGDGSLNISGCQVGIGAGMMGGGLGTATVNGGTINVTAEQLGIGMMAGYGSSTSGAVNINGGHLTVSLSGEFPGTGIGVARQGMVNVSVTITGGTTVVQNGRISAGFDAGVIITGGSVQADGILPAPTNGSTPVYATTIAAANGKSVQALALKTQNGAVTYGKPEVVPVNGKLTLYLPVGTYTGAAIIGGNLLNLNFESKADAPTTGTAADTGVIVTVPDGTQPSTTPDGTVTVPAGGTITTGTGPTVTLPGGGTADKDGNVSGGTNGSIVIGDNTITPPTGDTVTTDKDGKTKLPGGSTVVNGDTTVTVGDGTSGGSIGKDGNITLPSGGEITVRDKNGNSSTVQVPATGGDVTVKNDGTVTAPGGSTVTPPGGKPPVTVPEGGGTVGGDGGITSNSTVTSVAVSPATVSIQVGNTQQLTATVTGTNSPVQTVTWTSSHPAVATVNASGLVTAVANGTATITAVSTLDTSKSGMAAVTVTSPSSGGSTDNDSGNSSSGGTVVTPPAIQDNPTPPTTVETGVEVNTDKNGNATATVPDKDVTDAIEKAQKAVKKNDTEKNNIAIVLNVNVKENANSLEITLSEASITALRNAKAVPFTIKNGLTTMTFDLAALNALAGGEVKLTISKVDVNSLSAEAQKAIGGRPVFSFKVTVGGKAVTDFKGGRIGLQMPYTHTATELSGNLCGAFIDTNGKVAWLESSSYDALTSTLLTSTTHLSVYGIGYKENTPTFTDTAKHWAKNDIDFVVARGLLTGTGSTTFAPDQSMTGAILITALGRLAGANANKIVNGTSATTFTQDKAITRQEMAVMLVNYSKSIGYKLPSVHAEIVFTDSANISTWAKDAVKQTQMAGILMGKNGNKFDPTAIATRAEGSAMLHRFVELVVNTETAEGWTMNESGQWLYIENGKRITGEKTIDGKAYTFDRYGVTIALPPERKYLTYTVQKGDSFWSIARKYKISMLKLAEVNGKTISSVIHAGEELKIPD